MPSAPLILVTSTTTAPDKPAVYVPAAYTDALVAAGMIPFVLPPIDPSLAIEALRGVAGLVLTGGEDIDSRWFDEPLHCAAGPTHVVRDAYEIALARAARKVGLPTLALCRGAQIMNVALGGSLIQDISSQRPEIRHPKSAHPSDRVHAVDITAESRLAGIVGTTSITANSFHHQAIDRLGNGLKVVGQSPDGIVEAIETTDSDWWMVGVQWHPEELTNTDEDWDRRLFSAFRAAISPS